MSQWTWYPPESEQERRGSDLARRDELTETVGAGQLQLMLKARRSAEHSFTLAHGRANNRQRMAARRLVERGLLAGPNYVGRQPALRNLNGDALGPAPLNTGGWFTYRLTERGASCWLRVKA